MLLQVLKTKLVNVPSSRRVSGLARWLRNFDCIKHCARPVCARSKTTMAVSNATRLERRQDVRDRIAFLVRQDEEVLAEKRKRIEEMLWAIHEADIGDYFETREIDGKTIEGPKRLADLPTEIRKNIEKITIDGRGRAVPQLYSKLAASQELRKMLNIGRTENRNDLARLSDAELIQQLADTAKELGLKINLNYSFAPSATETETDGSE
jgi:hypothetical protein